MLEGSQNSLFVVQYGSRSKVLNPVDQEKFERTEAEWSASVLAYLMFRAGSDWRGRKPRYRKSPEYRYYLDGLRMMQRLRDVDPRGCTCSYCRPIVEDRAAKKAELGRLIEDQIASYERSRRKPPRSIKGADIAAAPLRLAMD